MRRPFAIAEAAAARRCPVSPLAEHGKLMMIACDHPARGAPRAGERALTMGDRQDPLDRLCLTPSRPGVNGVLGTPDILEDLLLPGPLGGNSSSPWRCRPCRAWRSAATCCSRRTTTPRRRWARR